MTEEIFGMNAIWFGWFIVKIRYLINVNNVGVVVVTSVYAEMLLVGRGTFLYITIMIPDIRVITGIIVVCR